MKKLTLVLLVVAFVSTYSCQEEFVDTSEAIAEKKGKKKPKSDCECDKEVGITQLSLEYKGPLTSGHVVVTTKVKKGKKGKNDEKDKKKPKKDEIVQIAEFNLPEIIDLNLGLVDGVDRLGTDTWISIDGGKPFKIHTSCSQPILPGTVFGDFVVLSGASGDLVFDCEIDPPTGDCDNCEGQITYLELEYLGDQPATIEVYGHKKHDTSPFFTTSVSPGDTFGFSGKERHGKMGPKIFLKDGSGQKIEIHTSCSQPIEVGMIFGGKYLIRSGASHEGGALCGEIKDCESELQGLIPNGPVNFIVTDYEGESHKAYFEMNLMNAGALSGTYDAYCIELDGTAERGFNYEADIYTSYESLPAAVFNRLKNPEVLDMVNYIINTYKVGDIVPFTFGPDACNLAPNGRSGVVTGGDIQQAIWYITDGKFGTSESLGDFAPMRYNAIICDALKNGPGFEPECGQKIGFVVAPRNSGQIVLATMDCVYDCAPPKEEECAPCEGKITTLDLEYQGGESNATITVYAKGKGKNKDNGAVLGTFTGINNGSIFKIDKPADKSDLGTAIFLQVNNGPKIEIHTSCSKPIGVGSVFGDYKVIAGASRVGGQLCEL